MPNTPLRVGLIGCGNIALRAHAPALLQTPQAQVVALADPVPECRARVQALLGLPASAAHAEAAAVLAERPDYVVVTVPQKYRRPIIAACARAGVHVLCEKPLATTPADAQAMIETMRAAGLRFGMVHNYLYYPEYVLARELIEAGALGRLRHVTLNFLGMPDHPGAAEYRPAWRHDPLEAGGGILMDMVHAVYVAEYFFGGPARSALAVVDNLDHPGEAVEDFTLVQYGFDQGYASVNMWWGQGVGGLELSGTAGRVLAFYENYDTGPFTTLASFTLVNRDGRQDLQPRGQARLADNFVRLHADFGEAVRTGREPLAPAEAGRHTMEAVLAAYMSAATGRVVDLPLSRDHPVYQNGLAGMAGLALWPDSPLARKGLLGVPRRREG